MLQETAVRDLCIFAHFDRGDKVADYVVRYLKAIASCGFDIVVVSTSKLGDGDIASLRAVATDVIIRDNAGLDFASWAHGLARHGDRVTGDLLLANDSVYGPIDDLPAAVARLQSVEADVYGMVESDEIAPHLQSWFLLLRSQVHRHPQFAAFFSQPFARMSKAQIIESGEVGFSRRLQALGFRLHAANAGWNPNHVRRRFPANPTHFFWRELIEDGVPFIKVELLRDNPTIAANLREWRAVVGRRAPGLIPLIEAHQRALVARDDGDTRPPAHPSRGWRLQRSFVHREFRLVRRGQRFLCAANWLTWKALEFVLRLRGQFMRRKELP